MLTQARLHELAHYDPATGVFTARRRTGGTITVGSVLGTLRLGYVRVTLDGERHDAHRLAFLYMRGTMPSEVDHRNRDRADNRWCNLRSVTRSENQQNTLARRDSRVGIKGVTPTPDGTYRAQIRRGGVNRYLGTFATPELAGAAYTAAAKGECRAPLG